jgi:hypothetical protein
MSYSECHQAASLGWSESINELKSAIGADPILLQSD